MDKVYTHMAIHRIDYQVKNGNTVTFKQADHIEYCTSLDEAQQYAKLYHMNGMQGIAIIEIANNNGMYDEVKFVQGESE